MIQPITAWRNQHVTPLYPSPSRQEPRGSSTVWTSEGKAAPPAVPLSQLASLPPPGVAMIVPQAYEITQPPPAALTLNLPTFSCMPFSIGSLTCCLAL